MARLRTTLIACFVAALVGVLVAPAAPAAPRPDTTYEVTALGTLGGDASFALDVNDRRQVTGNARTSSATLPLLAFLWEDGVMTNLGTLPGSNPFSRGYGINDAGVVVGESDNNRPRAFRWRAGELDDLGDLGAGSAVAHDVSPSGVAVGASSNGTVTRPVLFQRGQVRDLGTLAGTQSSSGRAWGINARGQAAGVSLRSSGPSQATLWDTRAQAVPIRLGSLGDGEQFSQAFAVSNRGAVVGESVVQPGTTHAFLWQRGRMLDLGALDARHSRATDVNSRGQIVGHVGSIVGFPSAGGRAFLWQEGEMADLNGLLTPESGWVLRSAEGINERGDIVGFGDLDGKPQAFLLTPARP